MSYPKTKMGRLAVPAVLAVIAMTALVVSPAIGGPSFLTKKKATKLINKKIKKVPVTTASEVRLGDKDLASPNINDAGAVLGSLSLTPGAYVVTSTFDVERTTGLDVACQLSAGSATDKLDAFSAAGATKTGSALSVTTTLAAAGKAELRCSDFNGAGNGFIRNAEITVLKVASATTSVG
jgi:hypothetical protein